MFVMVDACDGANDGDVDNLVLRKGGRSLPLKQAYLKIRGQELATKTGLS